MLDLQESAWVGKSFEPLAVQQLFAESATDEKPSEVSSSHAEIRCEISRNGIEFAAADKDSCGNVDDFLADWNADTRGHKQDDHGEGAIVADELVQRAGRCGIGRCLA